MALEAKKGKLGFPIVSRMDHSSINTLILTQCALCENFHLQKCKIINVLLKDMKFVVRFYKRKRNLI